MNYGSEQANRQAKVDALVAVTPIGMDPKANADNLRLLEQATPAQRAAYALKYAGCKTPPSDRTWSMFLEAMRARLAPANDRPCAPSAEDHPFLSGLR